MPGSSQASQASGAFGGGGPEFDLRLEIPEVRNHRSWSIFPFTFRLFGVPILDPASRVPWTPTASALEQPDFAQQPPAKDLSNQKPSDFPGSVVKR